MNWRQLTLLTERGQVDALEAQLESLDALAITLEDAADTPIFEPGLGETPLWPRVRLTALFEGDVDSTALDRALNLPASSEGLWEVIADTDWTRSWMDRFAPLHCGGRLWIVPSWCEAPDPAAVNVALDPGLAFGTGGHPTTAMCLEWLATAAAEGARVLDYGCGSGILAIAALKLGAGESLAVDIDPQALAATRMNAERNHLPPGTPATALPEAAPPGQYDIVLANILAGPLVELAPALLARLAPGGRLVLSGILAEQAPQVAAAYAPEVRFAPPRVTAGWALLAGQRQL